MMHHVTARRVARRAAAAALALGLGALGGCNDFLTAENPGAIKTEDLTDPRYISALANTGQMGFQNAQDDVIYWTGQFVDELRNTAVFAEEGKIDRRELFSDMTYLNAFTYGPMQTARFLAEDASSRLIRILGDSAGRDVRVARNLAYAGYSYVYLAEMMCVTPINRGVPKTSAEMFGDAIAKFDSTIAIATAARAFAQAQVPVNATLSAVADSIRFFALVGAARAALNRDELARAIGYATQVPANFVWREWYSENTTGQRHRVYDRLQLGSNAVLTSTPFAAMTTDPRVPRFTSPAAIAGKPLSPPSYTTYNDSLGNSAGRFAAVMGHRIASGLETRYVIAEASLRGGTGTGAMTDAQVLAFLNERRTAGRQTALPAGTTRDAMLVELRDQRSRDFYLDGHRLGDLRRYREFHGVDLFPKGPYPGSTTGQVYNETVFCWPLPTTELNDNPNAGG